MRARARLSIAGLRSTPTARAARGAEQLQHPAGAGAEVEQRLHRGVADEVEDRRLDLRVGGVHGADAVPLGRLGGEIGRRLLAPRLARQLQPGAVGGERRIGGGDAGQKVARQGAAGLGEAEERPGALAMALGEPGVDQQLEVAGDARLRLAEDADEFAHRQLRFAEQAEQPQPRHLAGRFQGGEQGVEGQGGGGQTRHKDMFMSSAGDWQVLVRA